MDSRALHAIAGRFARLQHTQDLSAGQEWLWAMVIADLEWRRMTTYPVWRACSCMFCIPPFPDPTD